MKTVLCICTYRRPEGLRKLLHALPSVHGSKGLDIVIADNDEGVEGLAVCNELSADYPFKIHTVHVSQAGISAARNTVTVHALSLEPELVVFLDDDEWPEPQWLDELRRIQRNCNADVVGGPTLPLFPEGTALEIRQNRYYGADLGLRDASACQLQAGGNFLIKASVLRKFAPTFFHPSFAHSGGEDLAFFTLLGQQGYSMYWAANAIVHEPVPESRLQDDWLRHRVINNSNSRVRVMQLLQPGFANSTLRVIKTLTLGLLAAVLSATAWIAPGLGNQAQMLRWKFQGKLSAHLGRATVRRETY